MTRTTSATDAPTGTKAGNGNGGSGGVKTGTGTATGNGGKSTSSSAADGVYGGGEVGVGGLVGVMLGMVGGVLAVL
jgi:hypothetical protein